MKKIQGIGQGVTVRRWIDKLLRETPEIQRKKIKIRKSIGIELEDKHIKTIRERLKNGR